MKLITRETDYAIRALVYMARDTTRLVSAQELVDTIDMPRAFLRRLLQTLNKHDILSSFKGKRGGFSFKVPPSRVHVVRLIEIFQGESTIINCIFKKDICPDTKKCPLRKKIKSIEKKMYDELRTITIASLIKEG